LYLYLVLKRISVGHKLGIGFNAKQVLDGFNKLLAHAAVHFRKVTISPECATIQQEMQGKEIIGTAYGPSESGTQPEVSPMAAQGAIHDSSERSSDEATRREDVESEQYST
jgi:hypothetical protein